MFLHFKYINVYAFNNHPYGTVLHSDSHFYTQQSLVEPDNAAYPTIIFDYM
jgi:hypothetical protein